LKAGLSWNCTLMRSATGFCAASRSLLRSPPRLGASAPAAGGGSAAVRQALTNRLARSNRLAGGLLRRVFFFAARLGLSRGGSAREAHDDSERATEAEREAKLAHFSVHPDSSIEAPPSQIATHGRVGKIRLPQLLSAPCEWNDPFPPLSRTLMSALRFAHLLGSTPKSPA
jgi:hypothetical protein